MSQLRMAAPISCLLAGGSREAELLGEIYRVFHDQRLALAQLSGRFTFRRLGGVPGGPPDRGLLFPAAAGDAGVQDLLPRLLRCLAARLVRGLESQTVSKHMAHSRQGLAHPGRRRQTTRFVANRARMRSGVGAAAGLGLVGPTRALRLVVRSGPMRTRGRAWTLGRVGVIRGWRLAVGRLADGAPRRGAPRRGAPRRGAPRHGAPRRGAPRRGAPRRGAPRRGAPRRGAPRRGAPRRADAGVLRRRRSWSRRSPRLRACRAC